MTDAEDWNLAEARATRLLLAALEDDDVLVTDAVTRILVEVDGCPDCTVGVILALLRMLADPISRSEHREHWVAHLQRRAAALLDELAAEP